MPAITTYHFSVTEFEKLHEAGILGEDDRVELLNGELLVMAPIHLTGEAHQVSPICLFKM
jgi:Uma2 family endonuclease